METVALESTVINKHDEPKIFTNYFQVVQDDTDFCYHCDKITTWTVDNCKNCGRVWGHGDWFR